MKRLFIFLTILLLFVGCTENGAGVNSSGTNSTLHQLENLAHRLNQPKGTWKWDIVKDELLWSVEVFEMFGLSPEEFAGTYEGFLATVRPKDRKFVQWAVEEALKGVPYSIQHYIVLPDGTERLVHEKGKVFFDLYGKPIRMEGIVQDITRYGQNSEKEWREFILVELRGLSEKQQNIRVDVAMLKVKAGVWGAIAGAIPAAVMLVVMLIRGKL